MNGQDGEGEFLYELHAEVDLELIEVAASHPEQEERLPIEEWLFDPADAERAAVGLRGVRDAVEALEDLLLQDESPDDAA
ncbi:hypothetical protein AB0K18_49135 [Nonomuraea sp. NPDC049421]|uniref:hypothetical protein n=1 Tax=Nonomuraea sp. NPDC049421 TaxID=3155275 RepID=UPI00341EE8A9